MNEQNQTQNTQTQTQQMRIVNPNIGTLLGRIAVGFVGGAVVALILALIMRLAFGYDVRLSFGIFALILTALAFGLFPPDIPRFAKFVLYTTVVVIYGMTIIAVWPAVEYGLMTAGPRSTEAYKERKRYEDLRIGETLHPKTLGGREVARDYRENREALLNEWYQSEQQAIVEMLRRNLIYTEEADRRMVALTAQYDRDLAGIHAIVVSGPGSSYKQISEESDPAPLGSRIKKSIPNFPLVLRLVFIAAAAFLILGLIWKHLSNRWLRTAALLAIGGTAIYFIIAILQSSGVTI